MRRSGNNALDPAASEAWPRFDQRDFGLFALEDKRDKNTLAPSPFIRGKSTQTFSAVNQLFNLDLHLGIVRFAHALGA